MLVIKLLEFMKTNQRKTRNEELVLCKHSDDVYCISPRLSVDSLYSCLDAVT